MNCCHFPASGQQASLFLLIRAAMLSLCLLQADDHLAYAATTIDELTVSNSTTLNGNVSIGTTPLSTVVIGSNTSSSSSITGSLSSLTLNNSGATLQAGEMGGFITYTSKKTLPTDPDALATELGGVGDAESRARLAGASYVNRIAGDTLVNGDLHVNGSIAFTGDTTIGGFTDSVNQIGHASTSVNTISGKSTTISSTENTISGNTTIGSNANSVNTMGSSTAVNSINGNTNTISGTTSSIITGDRSSLTLDNSGAALQAGGMGGFTTYTNTRTLPTDQNALATELGGVGDAESRARLAGASYVNRIAGDTLINGNLHVNGTINNSSFSAVVSKVAGGTSILPGGSFTAGTIAAVNKGEVINHAQADENGVISVSSGEAPRSSVSITLNNGYGDEHGLVVDEKKLTLSGGIRSTSLTLNDDGATFRTIETGGPAMVTGVADGTKDYDAVNYRQLQSVRQEVRTLEQDVSGGVAMTGALAAVPQVEIDNTLTIGTGIGHYNGESALAIGSSIRPMQASVVKIGMALSSQKESMLHAGVGYSW